MTSAQFQKFSQTSFQTYESLPINLSKPPDEYNSKSLIQHYSNFAVTADSCLVGTTEKKF